MPLERDPVSSHGTRDGRLPRPIDRWLGWGLFWLPVGMAITPGHHPRGVYHWTLGLLLFLPALVVLLRGRAALARRWWTAPPVRLCLATLAWASLTLCWATGPQLVERLKAPIFVLLYLAGWLAWAVDRERTQVQAWLYRAGLALAGAALMAMIAFHWRDIPWRHRMIGLALLDGPNLSAYVMSVALLLVALLLPPTGAWRRAGWLAMPVLLVFVGWTGSRGAWLALAGCLVLLALCHRDRVLRWLAAASLAALGGALCLLPETLLRRGLSYRPQIFRQALDMIAARPLGGLGLGSDYRVHAGQQVLTHSHNLFTNVAIETGLPGLVLWLVLWGWMGWQGWRARGAALGRTLLAIWLFASLALQLDGPSFLQSPRPEWLLTWLPLALALQLALELRWDRAAQPGAGGGTG